MLACPCFCSVSQMIFLSPRSPLSLSLSILSAGQLKDGGLGSSRDQSPQQRGRRRVHQEPPAGPVEKGAVPLALCVDGKSSRLWC